MKQYEVYIYNGFNAKLRYETNDINEAYDKAREIEKTSKEEFEGTALYDTIQEEWFGRHERGTRYILGLKKEAR